MNEVKEEEAKVKAKQYLFSIREEIWKMDCECNNNGSW